jgi:hypothetical protein
LLELILISNNFYTNKPAVAQILLSVYKKTKQIYAYRKQNQNNRIFSIYLNHFIHQNSFHFDSFFLLIDFALRGSGFGKWSILGLIAEKLVSILKLEQKPIYFPPKQFAAQVGFIFSLLLLIFNIVEINSIIISIILLICAGLEAFANFCVGCYVYNFYYQIKNRP